MSEKLIFNDNEVILNEDVQTGMYWIDRDLCRFYESLISGQFGAGPATIGAISGGAVISGLFLSKSTTDLTMSIGRGQALIGFGSFDPDTENSFQVATLDATSSVSLSTSDPVNERWDIIEISGTRLTTSEIRQVLTLIPPHRRLIPTVVPKTLTRGVTVRVRAGTPAAVGTALAPAVRPDPAWLPLYICYVPPAAATGNDILAFDLRKLATRFRPGQESQRGSEDIVCSSSGKSISVNIRNFTIGGYEADPLPIPVGGISLATSHTQQSFNINDVHVKASNIVYAPNTWYYAYAFRPHASAGLIGFMVSDVPPKVSSSLSAFPLGAPITPFSFMPAPWSGGGVPAMFLCAFKVYNNGVDWSPREFKKIGRYVKLTGFKLGSVDTESTNIYTNPAVTAGTYTIRCSPSTTGAVPVIPPHVRCARVQFEIRNVTSPGGLSILTMPSQTIQGSVIADTGQSVVISDDVILDSGTDFQVQVTGAFGLFISVQGYWEET